MIAYIDLTCNVSFNLDNNIFLNNIGYHNRLECIIVLYSYPLVSDIKCTPTTKITWTLALHLKDKGHLFLN